MCLSVVRRVGFGGDELQKAVWSARCTEHAVDSTVVNIRAQSTLKLLLGPLYRGRGGHRRLAMAVSPLSHPASHTLAVKAEAPLWEQVRKADGGRRP